MAMDEVRVKVTAETAELQEHLAALKAKAEGTVAAVLNVRTLAKVCAALFAMLVALCGLAGVLSVRQGKALAGAQAFSAAQQQIVDQAQKRMDQREADWQKQRAEWERERAAIQTAPQAVRVIEKYVPQTTGQSVPDVKPEQIAPEVRQNLPNAPSYVVKTTQAEVETAKAVQAGQQCASALQKCEKDAADLRTQAGANKSDRDNWRETAQGGSTSKRTARVGLISLCGAGGAAAGAIRGSKGAAIGSFVGAVACAIWAK